MNMEHKPRWFATFRSAADTNRIHIVCGNRDMVIQARPSGITKTIISPGSISQVTIASDEVQSTVRLWVTDFIDEEDNVAATYRKYLNHITRLVDDLYCFTRADNAAYTITMLWPPKKSSKS